MNDFRPTRVQKPLSISGAKSYYSGIRARLAKSMENTSSKMISLNENNWTIRKPCMEDLLYCNLHGPLEGK